MLPPTEVCVIVCVHMWSSNTNSSHQAKSGQRKNCCLLYSNHQKRPQRMNTHFSRPVIAVQAWFSVIQLMTTCANCQHPDKSLLSLLVLNGISRVTHRSSALFSSYSSSYSYILPSFPFYLPFLHCPPFLSSSWHILLWPTYMRVRHPNCLRTAQFLLSGPFFD